MTPTLLQISSSPGGMPKLPVLSPIHISLDGVPNDWQTNRKYHGGPDRAICLFSLELYHDLHSEGLPLLPPGSLGENFTTQHLNLNSLTLNTRLQIGTTCIIQLTDIRTPCRNLNQWDPHLLHAIQGRSGWVARVLSPGSVSQYDPIQILK